MRHAPSSASGDGAARLSVLIKNDPGPPTVTSSLESVTYWQHRVETVTYFRFLRALG